jgi:hypothetical protein
MQLDFMLGRIPQDRNRELGLVSGTIPEQGVTPEIGDGHGDRFVQGFGLHLR